MFGKMMIMIVLGAWVLVLCGKALIGDVGFLWEESNHRHIFFV